MSSPRCVTCLLHAYRIPSDSSVRLEVMDYLIQSSAAYISWASCAPPLSRRAQAISEDILFSLRSSLFPGYDPSPDTRHRVHHRLYGMTLTYSASPNNTTILFLCHRGSERFRFPTDSCRHLTAVATDGSTKHPGSGRGDMEIGFSRRLAIPKPPLSTVAASRHLGTLIQTSGTGFRFEAGVAG